MNDEFSIMRQVSDELQAYVYMLVDPRDGKPFYVGKGQGLRHSDHESEAMLPEPIDETPQEHSRKIDKIKELLSARTKPEVWILRYGLRIGEYTAVEAATIDLLMSFPLLARPGRVPLGEQGELTNRRREGAAGHGIALLQTIIDEFAAPPLRTLTPLVLITLAGWEDLNDEPIAGNRTRRGAGFKREWLVSSYRRQAYEAIGDSVAGWWSMSERSINDLGISHAVAVHRGVTRALFKILPETWEVDLSRRDKNGRAIRKTSFQYEIVDSGSLFEEVVGPHGHRLPSRPRGARNSFSYWPAQ